MEKVKEEERPKWFKTILDDFQVKNFISFYYDFIVECDPTTTKLFLYFKQVSFRIYEDGSITPFLFLSPKFQYVIMENKVLLYSKEDKIFKKLFGKAFEFPKIDDVDAHFDGYEFNLNRKVDSVDLSQEQTQTYLIKYATEKSYFNYFDFSLE